MNSALMLSVGVVVGVLIGRSMVQCAASSSGPTAKAVVAGGIMDLTGKLVDRFLGDDEDKR